VVSDLSTGWDAVDPGREKCTVGQEFSGAHAGTAQSLANGTELTADELEQFARGVVILVDWLVDLPVNPPRIEGWTAETRHTHKYHLEYRLSILRYVPAMAESIMAGTCLLDEQSSMEHRLLLEFFWLLHKTPEYLVQTNCMDCCEGLDILGERQAGLQELWDIIAKTNLAGVQTLQRRMMLHLGELERGGCIRLDQVWNAPNSDELAQNYLAAKQLMLDVLEGPSEKFQERAQAIQADLQAVQSWPSRTPRRAGAEPEGSAPLRGDGRVRR
jgi:hypothetical protein